MKRKKRKKMILACGFMMLGVLGCGTSSDDSEVNTEEEMQNTEIQNTEEIALSAEEIEKEIVKYEELYSNEIVKHTDEVSCLTIVDDFDYDGEYEAYVVTADEDWASRVDDFDGFITSSLWYLNDMECINLYMDNGNGSVMANVYTLNGGEKAFAIHNWYSNSESTDLVYMVIDNSVELLLNSYVTQNENGNLQTSDLTREYDDEMGVYGNFTEHVSEYIFENNKFVKIKEWTVEY